MESNLTQRSDSCIIPERTHPRFFAQHLVPYKFARQSAKDKVILDIGFGDGYGTAFLAEVAKEVIGVDFAQENVERAKSKYERPNLKFYQMDATALEFESNRFNVICSFQVIEHIEEDKILKYLNEISRVLKADGFFYLSTMNREVSMKTGERYEKNPEHVKEFDFSELHDILSKAFPNVEIYGLRPTPRHRFYQRLKRAGIFNVFPERVNPVLKFYNNITCDDFEISEKGISHSLDFICVCKK